MIIVIPLFVVVVICWWGVKSLVRSYPVGDYISSVIVSFYSRIIYLRDAWRKRNG